MYDRWRIWLFALRLRWDSSYEAMRKIQGEEERNYYLLTTEGRGIGLINKMKAYNLQDEGLNTAEANVHLGFEIDARDYDIAIRMLKDLGVPRKLSN